VSEASNISAFDCDSKTTHHFGDPRSRV